jgi:asparagine synthase (glutamine-hydrolysing)
VPGILGLVSARGPDDAKQRFDAAAERMLRHPGTSMAHRRYLDGRACLGHVTLGAGRPTPPPTTPRVVFHGVLYNLDELRERAGGNTGVESGAGSADLEQVLSAHYARQGPAFVSLLEGEFCLALVDEQARRLLVATDHVASYPIRWRLDAGGFVFSSDLSALLRAAPEARRLNLRAVADYLTFGAVLGDKTLVEGVRELDPGSLLTYDDAAGRVSIATYCPLHSFFDDEARNRDEYYERVREAFSRAVVRSMTKTNGSGPVGLSLSGGLDSRAILSAAHERAADLRTYTLGVEGCADQVIAARLARIAGASHFYFRLDDSYLRDFLPNMASMVSVTDGCYLSHGLTEMLAIRFLPDTGVGVLLRGHGGELAKAHLAWPLHTDERVRNMASTSELAQYLGARANYISPDVPHRSLLEPWAAAAAGAGSTESFAAALDGLALSPAEGCSYLYLRELHRRFTVPSLELFRTRVEVRLPFTDRRFLRALLGAPAAWRDSTDIHRRLIAAGLPALGRVRNSNTGAPANAGLAAEFVLDKLNTLLKRANVYGFRHYHNFDAWTRRMLLDAIESELLASSARVQAYVPKEKLARLMLETREGVSDRAYLLQVLLILELWQREHNVEVQ